LANERIIVVEDQGIVALDIRDSLRRLGYRVPAMVTSGEAAIEQAERLQPDLVLMDIMLEAEIDGIAAAEQIRSRLNIPVIFVTAYADEDTLRRAKAVAPFGYLIKPFKDRDLLTNIEVALYRHRVDQALRRRDAIMGAVSFAAHRFRLFTPFSWLREEGPEGHGLGLSIVQQIIARIGGTVGIESQPGQGSLFYFTLPAAPDRQQESIDGG